MSGEGLVHRSIVVLPLLLAAKPASAEVVSATESTFVVETKQTVAASPQKVWETLVRPAGWWESSHTYSGDSANISIDARPGGCWCEKIKDGAIEHMRVVYVQPAQVFRGIGGFGPLQEMPVNAVLTVTIKPAGAGSAVTYTYRAAGFMPGGLAKVAPIVDQVLSSQWARLKPAAEKAQ